LTFTETQNTYEILIICQQQETTVTNI